MRASAAELDLPWARTWAAWLVREWILWALLTPIMIFYVHRKAAGRNKLARVRGPVIFAANHTSHLDTPVILAALPKRFRKRTVVAAATDYFYQRRFSAALVSLIFNTVPMDRSGGGLEEKACAHVDQLLEDGWSLLLYPEGTRSRSGTPGRVRRGAAVLAKRHDLQIVPIRVTGTRDAMPPGRFWPHRKQPRGQGVPRRHPVSLEFGDPIPARGDPVDVIEEVRRFFDGDEQVPEALLDGIAAADGAVPSAPDTAPALDTEDTAPALDTATPAPMAETAEPAPTANGAAGPNGAAPTADRTPALEDEKHRTLARRSLARH